MGNETQQTGAAEIFIRAIVAFPKTFFYQTLSVLVAVLTDWETFVLTAGAGLIAYATGAYYLVGGALLILYALLRVLGSIAAEHTMATGLHGRVIRDNWQAEHYVAITQLPAVLTTQSEPDPAQAHTDQLELEGDDEDVGT